MQEYAGVGMIAQWCGVTNNAVSMWRLRFDNCPEPTVVIRRGGELDVYGWPMSSKPAWLAFQASPTPRGPRRLQGKGKR